MITVKYKTTLRVKLKYFISSVRQKVQIQQICSEVKQTFFLGLQEKGGVDSSTISEQSFALAQRHFLYNELLFV